MITVLALLPSSTLSSLQSWPWILCWMSSGIWHCVGILGPLKPFVSNLGCNCTLFYLASSWYRPTSLTTVWQSDCGECICQLGRVWPFWSTLHSNDTTFTPNVHACFLNLYTWKKKTGNWLLSHCQRTSLPLCCPPFSPLSPPPCVSLTSSQMHQKGRVQ